MSVSRFGFVVFLSLLTSSLGFTPSASRGAIASLRSGNQPLSNSASQIAQNLAGQCRQLRRLERVYSSANLVSNPIADLQTGTRVTLAGAVNQPQPGWIQINVPYSGYIQTAFLAPCAAATPTPPSPSSPPPSPSAQSNACGVAQVDLAIKTQPNTQSASTGQFVQAGQGFQITGEPRYQAEPASEAGRAWIPINRFGITGWVAETGPDGFGRNVQRVQCSSIGIDGRAG